MPEYSSTPITPADGVQVPSMNGSTSGNFLLSALRDYILASKGQANGLASLGSDGKLTPSQLPDLADDVIVVASYAVLPATGTAGKIYITADNNKMYRWDSDLSTPDYVELSVDLSEYAKLTDLAAEESARETADTNLNNAINQLDHRLENIEQSKGDYIVSSYKDGSTTPSGKGKWCVVEGVEGVSRVENNHLNKSFSPSTTINNVTFTNNGDGSWTVSTNGAASGTAYVQCCNDIPALGHKWLISGCPSGGNGSSGFTLWDASNSAYDNGSGVVFSPTNAINVYIRVASGTSIPTPIVYWPVLTDLNVYFNTSDLSFLGATDSAKLATIQRDYPHLLTPSEYGTRIVDWTGNGVRAYPANILEPMTQTTPNGTYSDGTYTNNTRLGDSAWTGKIDVSDIGQVTIAYDSCNGEFRYGLSNNDVSGSGNIVAECATNIGSASVTVNTSGFKFLYLYFRTFTAGTTATLAKARVNVGSTALAYSAYHAPNTLSFPSTTLKSAGSVYDSCELNVEVDGVAKKRETTRIATVDCTTLSWTYNSTYDWWRAMYQSGVPFSTGTKNCLYRVGLNSNINNLMGGTDLGYCMNDINFSSNESIYIRNGSSTTPPDGVFYYEAPTPTVTLSDPILDNTLLTEAGGRMATVQTGTVVDGIADLGFITL